MRHLLKTFMLAAGICLLPALTKAQKAYEAVYYKGAVPDLSVSFKLADGYIEASEIKTTHLPTKKTSSFQPETGSPDGEKKMKFRHVSSTGQILADYFILENMEANFEGLPRYITGNYYFNGKTYPLTLRLSTCP